MEPSCVLTGPWCDVEKYHPQHANGVLRFPQHGCPSSSSSEVSDDTNSIISAWTPEERAAWGETTPSPCGWGEQTPSPCGVDSAARYDPQQGHWSMMCVQGDVGVVEWVPNPNAVPPSDPANEYSLQ